MCCIVDTLGETHHHVQGEPQKLFDQNRFYPRQMSVESDHEI
jgi:hypothetical protein